MVYQHFRIASLEISNLFDQLFRPLEEQDYAKLHSNYLKLKNKKSKINKKSKKNKKNRRKKNKSRNRNQNKNKNQRVNKSLRPNKNLKRRNPRHNLNKLKKMMMVKNNKRKRRIPQIYYLQAHLTQMTTRDNTSLTKTLRIKSMFYFNKQMHKGGHCGKSSTINLKTKEKCC